MATLDPLLSLSLGLPMSSALLVEEDCTGNYSSDVLRQFVAYDIVQGDRVWILEFGGGRLKLVEGSPDAGEPGQKRKSHRRGQRNRRQNETHMAIRCQRIQGAE
jgi:PAXNEB protein